MPLRDSLQSNQLSRPLDISCTINNKSNGSSTISLAVVVHCYRIIFYFYHSPDLPTFDINSIIILYLTVNKTPYKPPRISFLDPTDTSSTRGRRMPYRLAEHDGRCAATSGRDQRPRVGG